MEVGVLCTITITITITFTTWPRQSGAPLEAALPTRSQLRLQRHTKLPVKDSHNGCHCQPTLDPLLADVVSGQPISPCHVLTSWPGQQ